jgi:hypothetical protein
MPLYSREFGTVMERIYARLGAMLEPAPPHKLPSIDNVLKIALTIELMRPLAIRQSLDQLFDLFIASRNLVLVGGMEDAAVKELNQATMGLARSALSAAWTHPTQTPSVRNLSDSLKFLVTHFDLLLRGEAHYETIEAILWSLDSTAAPREMSEGYFIPELDEEIDDVAVSPVFVEGFCALFDPSVPFRTRKAASLVFPLLTQSWFGRWMESVSETRNITWEQRKEPVMGNQEMVQFCQNWAVTVNQNPVDRDEQRDHPPQHALVDDVVVPVAQMHSGFAVPAPSLSRATSMELADAHGRVQVADVDTGSHFAQQAGRLEAVDYDLLDP